MGEDPRGPDSELRRRSMGYLPENVSFYQQLSGREVLNYFARLKGESIRVVDGLLQQVGLDHAADRRVKTYSKGMRQRIGLAQALLGHPQLLLLDEPTAGLDPQATGEFYSLLDDLRAEGVSILISSHVLPGVERHIDRAIIMGHGRLRAQGSLDELRAQARLPLLIRAQGGQSISDEPFRQLGYQLTLNNGHQLQLEGPLSGKMAAIRLLVNTPGIEDVEIIPPTLDSLYAHFNAAHDIKPAPSTRESSI
jgi:Cu-processing system ATP-binding protein